MRASASDKVPYGAGFPGLSSEEDLLSFGLCKDEPPQAEARATQTFLRAFRLVRFDGYVLERVSDGVFDNDLVSAMVGDAVVQQLRRLGV